MVCGAHTFHVAMKSLGPLLICLALFLMGFVAYTYLVHALPQMRASGLLVQCSLTSTGVFLLANALYNYGLAVLTDPGLPPDFERARAELEAEVEESSQPRPRQCRKCRRLKPPRSHHCSICNRCVLKMDHHCPWVNNCVGFRNYRHFCLFMLFLAAACLFIIAVVLHYFSDLVLHARRRAGGSRFARQCILASFMLCCSIFVALCVLGGFHAYLVLTNQTTIEFQSSFLRRPGAGKSGESRNPYDLGRSRNFQQVFGPSSLWHPGWMLPCLALPPQGDGLHFPSFSQLRL